MIVPIVFGSIINAVVVIISKCVASMSLLELKNITELVNSANELWFLWSVLSATIAVVVAMSISDKLWARMLILICMSSFIYVMPNGTNNLFMYPYFVISWLFAYYINSIPKWFINLKYVCIPVFIAMLFFFKRKHYIYTTGMFSNEYSLIECLKIDLFRYIIGFVGSISIIVVAKLIFNMLKKANIESLSKPIVLAGEKSLQIYIISVPLPSAILPMIFASLCKIDVGIENYIVSHSLIMNFIITPIIATIYAVLIYYITKILEKIGVSKCFFGR